MNRWLFLATGYAWLGQPDAARVRFAPERRILVRKQLQEIEADFRRARLETEPERRTALGRHALTALLTVIGQGDREEPASDALTVGLERVRELLPPGPLRLALSMYRQDPFAPLSPIDFEALSELFLFTYELVDTRTRRELQLEPWLLRGALLGAVLLFGWIFFGSHNISEGREVTASSICPATPAPPFERSRLHRVVDGIRIETTFAACTQKEVHPWIQVDLEEVRTVTSVVVHTRSDCCWGLDDRPLSVQLSEDGKEFTTVAVRRDFIMADIPWSASFSSQRARYVRLINESKKAKNIVVSEIEVYGR